MSVISYILHKCEKCLLCLKNCPTEAITIQHGRVSITSKKCINCGKCMEICKHAGLQAKGSTIVDKENYEKSILLVPTSIFADCSSQSEVNRLYSALNKLGFDEVVSLQEAEGAVYTLAEEYVNQHPQRLILSSFCPVIRGLIELRYPMLLDDMLPFDYPALIAAAKLRRDHPNQHLGIFLLCECPAKLKLAKYPYNGSPLIDHALSIMDLFPTINQLRDDSEVELQLNLAAILSVVNEVFFVHNEGVLSIDGIEKVMKVLEPAEFGILKEVNYLSLSACHNGCIGGKFVFGNEFNGKVNLMRLMNHAVPYEGDFTLSDVMVKPDVETQPNMESLASRMARFREINHVLEQLPNFDCGACGYPSCRTMAEAIVDGHQKIHDCRIIGKWEGEDHEGE